MVSMLTLGVKGKKNKKINVWVHVPVCVSLDYYTFSLESRFIKSVHISRLFPLQTKEVIISHVVGDLSAEKGCLTSYYSTNVSFGTNAL